MPARWSKSGTTAALFAAPRHPYTRGLLQLHPGAGPHASAASRSASIPGMVPRSAGGFAGCGFRDRCALRRGRRAPAAVPRASRPARPSLAAASSDCRREARRMTAATADRGAARRLRAFTLGADLSAAKSRTLHRGRRRRSFDDAGAASVLGIVGESGCGKSTLARMLLGLLAADERPHRARRRGRRPRSAARRSRARDPAGVPGPVLLAQPAPRASRHRRAAARRARHRHGGRAARQGDRDAGARRPAGALCRQLPGAAVGRPAPARRRSRARW